MKLAALILTTVICSAAHATTVTKHCITTEKTFTTTDSSIFDSLEKTDFPEPQKWIDRNLPAEVFYTSKQCSSGEIAISKSTDPNFGIDGDIRTVKQVIGDAEYSYQQEFVEGRGWVMTALEYNRLQGK